jgi:hypothetical protein
LGRAQRPDDVPEQLGRDMKELLEILNRWQAQYLVVGAHALGVYAEPRGTKDLDIWVNPTPENAKRVFGALKEYGAPLFETTEHFFTERDTFLVIGVVPNRIDILKSIPGVEFDACWRKRKTLDVGGILTNFPSLEDLLAAKIAAGRPQDLVDATKLKMALELERRRVQEQAPEIPGQPSKEQSIPETKPHKKDPKRGRGFRKGT